MQDPQIFYNKEDLWSIPKKQDKDMEPYYTIMKLPKGSNAKETPKEEFILLIPFTTAKRNNMAACLPARSNVQHYIKLTDHYFTMQKPLSAPIHKQTRAQP